jgi:hypothetical protein
VKRGNLAVGFFGSGFSFKSWISQTIRGVFPIKVLRWRVKEGDVGGEGSRKWYRRAGQAMRGPSIRVS